MMKKATKFHLLLMAFMAAGVQTALQKKDWKAFARLYNGPAYAQNRYDEKLSTAYSSFNK
ncbi:MAG: N-acetylmuramidase family protein, partial [Prevotella sp.]|nr:N-acetylmuramidase family protein [Prevotella sp.]